MGSKMSHDKRCSKPQAELFFRLFEAHHDGHLFVATKNGMNAVPTRSCKKR